MRYWIKENSHWYWPVFILPRMKKDLTFQVTFPETSWYDNQVQPGWNKTLMIGRLFHYSDYATIGWQWWDAAPGDDNVFKGRVLKLCAFYHDNWKFPQWKIFDYNFPTDVPISCGIVRSKNKTIFMVNDHAFELDADIRGNWLRSPYFGGRSKSQYNHMLKIKMI